jgi:2-dehydro-3-deoxyphosphogalactonate aldolase
MTGEFKRLLAPMPLIAVLRGLEPERAVETATALVECGFVALEVPINSPRPFESIAAVAAALGDKAVIGAGTVRRTDEIRGVADAGGRLIVMPHTDLKLIAEAKQRGLFVVPGAATPTEGFAALDAGADALKLFPAEVLSPEVLRAWRAVFPADAWFFPVGGITPERMRDYWLAGANGFGLGSALFKPDLAIDAMRANALRFISKLREVRDAA